MLNTTEENRLLYSSGHTPSFDQERATLLSYWLQNITPISRSLDIGCSSGGFSSLLPDKVEKWGLDFERHPDLPKQFNFLACDIAQSWSVPQNYFDVVLAGEVIEHVLDTDLFLQRCFDALRPGGYLLLTTPNLSSFANLRYWVQTDQYMWVDSGANQFGHVRYLAPKRMHTALKAAGFDSIVMKTVSGLESFQIFPLLHRFIQQVFPLRGNRLCVIACKP
ncbi:class I SAM-dependent methyltransferase [Iningainema tapete]|uniref:Class I SAM-dependent methyltransferase n=1 Tax=Iningainema tapete BLCC-T55 TaxID=2748662 RepID=A0A8J6XK97_9CYAN|nr:class I SAM-dependent methyltransferase [Iningainema tapete]MBD2772386.1 class I SAM-dependent methyltransferase [Iningainema tapete BLCC-T55]